MSLKYKEFKVYKDAKSLAILIFRLTRKFPKEFYYLSDQINRACLSIMLNIAEGSAKGGNKDFNRYIKNSLGSASELSAAIDLARDFGLASAMEFDRIENSIGEVIRQLGGFSKFLLKN